MKNDMPFSWIMAALVLASALFSYTHDVMAADESYCSEIATLPEDASKSDSLYISGECALERQQYREAIRIFNELLSIEKNPILQADLGRAYLGAQEFERAREQFLLALQSNPPDDAKKLLLIFIQMADQQKTQAKDWFAAVSAGIVIDNNANNGPKNANVILYGLPFTLDQASMPKTDTALHVSATLVKNKSLSNIMSWQTDAYVDVMNYSTYHNFDIGQIAIDTGPHVAIKSGVTDLYLPFGINRTTLGGQGYSLQTFFSPQINYLKTSTDLLTYSSTIARTLYDADPSRDATSSSIGFTWQHVLGNLWTIAPSLKLTSEHAESNAFDNFAQAAGLSLSGNLPYGIRFSASSLYTWAHYKEAEAWASDPRRYHKRNDSLSLTKDMGSGYYAILSWVDMNTDSNLGLYSTAKQQLQFQISKSF